MNTIMRLLGLSPKKPDAEIIRFVKTLEARRRDERVLLVDDEPSVRQTFTEILAPGRIVAVASLASAREILETTKFPLIVLDYRLTNGNGIDLYAEIAEKWPSQEVVFLTGFDSKTMREAVELIGPARVYSKLSATKVAFWEALFAQVGLLPIAPRLPAI